MNTRSFLKSLAIVCVAPQILIPRAPDAFRWSVLSPSYSMVNPDWTKAEYQVEFVYAYNPKAMAMAVPIIHLRNPACRYVFNRESGLFEKAAR